ncbi:hypothetical protein KAFR_0G00790 [Kazachstania africana CBS 2517]|uniref:Protein yippee-like n=1 Tax=Kazachstania africana (strain ATCC 22294 / BCRC 22015 / CBS 2517 / CECT 1963 / NBRC 1671 / NRRL Y-8276) TaxID=1071382 RepID=H2AXL2_KAZAF|nr:hypothetical protein KAFR_0G00790 [Kazachstania africana CBS 2517]CCF59112.1 hypothetical protein KAFR_0G00790 [Kazachstania africana CBS 2517]
MGIRTSFYIDYPMFLSAAPCDNVSVSGDMYSLVHSNRIKAVIDRKIEYIDATNFRIFACRNCLTHLTSTNEIISRNYRCESGKAFLMNNITNIIEDLSNCELRSMITGEYLVCDIYCHFCRTTLGWKYLKADSKDQAFKEGKFIIDLKKITLTT